MEMVLNRDWGGFTLPRGFCEAYDLDSYEDSYDFNRTDPRLIKWVEDHANPKGRCGDLAVVEIPDSCTDWEMNDYDGMESIIYVVDGKLHHA